MSEDAVSTRLALRPPRRVLVVQTAFLGDTVFTSALAAGLAARFPQASIELCVAPRGRDVARAIPAVARVHVFDKRGQDRGPSGLLRMARRVRGCDLAVLPHRSLRSAVLAFLARIPERVGFAGAPGRLFYTATAPDRGATFLEKEGQLAQRLTAQLGPMRLSPPPDEIAAADRALLPLGGRRFAALCVGSEWETKIWPAEHLAALAVRLRARGLACVLLGGPREKPLAARVLAFADCLDTTGNPVGEALGILSRASLCVGGDTGLVHAARAMGVPTVALFGPTPLSAHAFGPRERGVSLQLACSPCSAHGGRVCPLGHHRCLHDLDPGRVLDACESVLG